MPLEIALRRPAYGPCHPILHLLSVKQFCFVLFRGSFPFVDKQFINKPKFHLLERFHLTNRRCLRARSMWVVVLANRSRTTKTATGAEIRAEALEYEAVYLSPIA